MTPLSSTNPLTNQSSVLVLTYLVDSCAIWFDKTYWICECSLVPENQQKNSHDRKVLTCEAPLRTQTQLDELLEIISWILDRLTNWRAGITEKTCQIRRTHRGSEKSGSFSDWNPPDNRSRSFGYCQTKVMLFPLTSQNYVDDRLMLYILIYHHQWCFPKKVYFPSRTHYCNTPSQIDV